LIKKFKLTRKQAQAVLETRLQQLTSLEVDKLKKKLKLKKLLKLLKKKLKKKLLKLNLQKRLKKLNQ